MRVIAYSLATLFLLWSSCAGVGARGDVMPTIAASYHNIIEPIAIVGIGAEQDAGNLTEERANDLRAKVTLIGQFLDGGIPSNGSAAEQAWSILLPFAESGIDARVARGEIGPGVGASLKELLRLFGNRLVQLGTTTNVVGFKLTGEQHQAMKAFYQ